MPSLAGTWECSAWSKRQDSRNGLIGSKPHCLLTAPPQAEFTSQCLDQSRQLLPCLFLSVITGAKVLHQPVWPHHRHVRWKAGLPASFQVSMDTATTDPLGFVCEGSCLCRAANTQRTGRRGGRERERQKGRGQKELRESVWAECTEFMRVGICSYRKEKYLKIKHIFLRSFC